MYIFHLIYYLRLDPSQLELPVLANSCGRACTKALVLGAEAPAGQQLNPANFYSHNRNTDAATAT